MRFFRWLRVKLGIHLIEDALIQTALSINRRMSELTPLREPPLVHVVLYSDSFTYGTTARMALSGTTRLTVSPMRPLKQYSLAVFTDFERVSIRGMYVGNNLVSEGMAVVSGSDWDVGVQGCVVLELLKP